MAGVGHILLFTLEITLFHKVNVLGTLCLLANKYLRASGSGEKGVDHKNCFASSRAVETFQDTALLFSHDYI